MDLFEFFQAIAIVSICIAVIPEFITIYKKKGIATDALSIGTGALFVVESLLRLPNIGKGLFEAIQKKDRKQIIQLGLSSVGVFIICLSFYALIVLQAVYNTDINKDTTRDKHIARLLSVIYGIGLVLMIIYYMYGISQSMIVTSFILISITLYTISVIYGNREIDYVVKKKKVAEILSFGFSICVLIIIVYFYKGIVNASNSIIT